VPTAGWSWDESTRRYVNADGGTLSPRSLAKLRDDALDALTAEAGELGRARAAGEITSLWFVRGMRDAIKRGYAAAYMLGRGGRHAMRPSDWGRVGGVVRRQYRFLDGFVNELLGEERPSPEAAAARARLYLSSAVQGFERAQAAAHAIALPAYPGDGMTPCLGNCRCSWDIARNKDGSVEATWTLGGKDPCPGCRERAGRWNPWRSTVEATEPRPVVVLARP
jgi:hypothetical protein